MGNLIASLFTKQTKVVIVGLDAAGKTTILYRLKLDDDTHIATIPTIGFNVENLKIGKLDVTAWDIGGQDKIRHLWNHYFKHSDGIVLVIDSRDHSRFPLVIEEIRKLFENEELNGLPILILANKQDLPDCPTPNELIHILNLQQIRDRKWKVQPCCAITNEGLDSGFKWLAQSIQEREPPWWKSIF